jgi:hypothetical protein
VIDGANLSRQGCHARHPEGSAVHGRGHVPYVNPPPPPPRAPVSIEELLATQNKLMRVLVRNEANRGEEHLQHHRAVGHEHVLL